MRLIFGRSRLPLSPIIRFLTWSQWSHVAIQLDDGRVVEAIASGVRCVAIDECLKRMSKHTVVELEPVDDLKRIYAECWLIEQVGKKYDWGALFGFLFKRNWQSNNRWFCSELAAEFCKKLGYRIANEKQLNRVTPQFLYMITGAQW